MLRSLLFALAGSIVGVTIGYFIFSRPPSHSLSSDINTFLHNPLGAFQPKVVGFLPYWLVARAEKDYSKVISNLTYFSLTIDTDGKIRKLLNETEEEPGWTTLRSGKLDEHFENARKNGTDLSLAVFNANEEAVGQIIQNPIEHARNLANDIEPIMRQFGFTEVNLDIESGKVASDEARRNFTSFVQEFKKQLNEKKLGSLTLDASPTIFIKKFLIDPRAIEKYIDYMVIMAYDYHYQGSQVTGPVAPLGGAGVISEFDVKVGIEEAKKIIPSHKLILGIPLYGYEWETLSENPRSAVIPGSGLTASAQRVEEFLQSCSSCGAQVEKEAEEHYIVYKDTKVGTYHHIYFPDEYSLQSKLQFVRKEKLRGIALWALGYENDGLLEPLKNYK